MAKDPVLAAAENWLNKNPGKTLKDYYLETKYDGPKLKTKQRAGQPAIVGYRTEASTTGPAARRTEALKQQDLAYIETWRQAGFSETQAMKELKKSKSRAPLLEKLVRDLNRLRGAHSFTVGHETAAIEGGGDFDRNRRLERGKGSGGNYSRSSNDEVPDSVKPVLGIPRSGRGGQDAALMDMDPEMFDLGLTPQDRQRIKKNPAQADLIIMERQRVLAKYQPQSRPLTNTPVWAGNDIVPSVGTQQGGGFRVEADPLGLGTSFMIP